MGLFGLGRRADRTMTPSAAAAAAAEGEVLLVDVREPGEFRDGHAPGARLVPLAEVAGRAREIAGDGRPVAVICRSGMRSARAARVLRDAGVDARNVRGGMLAWEGQGLPVGRGEPRSGTRKGGRR